jgi:hypothetical protein
MGQNYNGILGLMMPPATKREAQYKRHRRVSGCHRKKQYKDRVTALHKAANWGQRVYQCPDCHQWHLTRKEVDG